MSAWWGIGAALLCWPGLIGGAALAWLLLWFQRKLAARLQGRKGPPFYQPCFDFIRDQSDRSRVLDSTLLSYPDMLHVCCIIPVQKPFYRVP